MRQKNFFVNLLMILLILVVASFSISFFVGILNSILWLTIKILLPLAIVIWLIRTISNSNRRHYRKPY
nr:hypothetical protein [Enterococcus ratti]